MTERAGKARQAMVHALKRSGLVDDPTVLDAMGRVPREWFVPRFWTFPAHRNPPVREWRADEPDDRETALHFLYDIDRALAIRVGPDEQVTATISAPTIVGSMLQLLDLRPGMHVLEIGAGSGYNAALLRELVGPGGAVTSIDIDGELVQAARQTLAEGGWADVAVVAGDGYLGAPRRAPFDRVVATVGCADLAPAWLQQLAPGGWCLLPLQHDGWHPLTRIVPEGDTGVGEVMGRSGF
ncbi:MAG: methyltransferase domain-containing protein, partial [Acidimicrobiaceae bacterium]|nr:methyltransferase domain-containing protein [Acidimicrobiaceae bacterium]